MKGSKPPIMKGIGGIGSAMQKAMDGPMSGPMNAPSNAPSMAGPMVLANNAKPMKPKGKVMPMKAQPLAKPDKPAEKPAAMPVKAPKMGKKCK